MGIDWQRLQQLEGLVRGNQWGFRASVLKRSVQGAQVLRFGGDVWDVNPWRVYLGAWQPRAGIAIPGGVTNNVLPSLARWPQVPGVIAPPRLSMAVELLLYAQISWGSGGYAHTAWVDWPVRGLLCQVSGSYVQVDAVAYYQDGIRSPSAPLDDTMLPDVNATLADEPGGGDAAASATFTYPIQSGDWTDDGVPDPTTGRLGIDFVVPPFARALRPLFDWSRGATLATPDNPNWATTAWIRFRSEASGSANSIGFDEQVIVVDFSDTAELGTYLSGLTVPAGTSYVRVEFEWDVGVDPDDRLAAAGAQFELDL